MIYEANNLTVYRVILHFSFLLPNVCFRRVYALARVERGLDKAKTAFNNPYLYVIVWVKATLWPKLSEKTCQLTRRPSSQFECSKDISRRIILVKLDDWCHFIKDIGKRKMTEQEYKSLDGKSISRSFWELRHSSDPFDFVYAPWFPTAISVTRSAALGNILTVWDFKSKCKIW